MKRIFSDYAYGAGPRQTCWWPETCDVPERPALQGAHHADVAIIGGGFTGMSAALHLAQAGVKTVLLETHFPGWGASGRNGGFCCLGGGMVDNRSLEARFGREGRRAFRQAERAGVDLVAQLIDRLCLDVDRHSDGETELAHRPKDMVGLRARAAEMQDDYGVTARIIEKSDLATYGMDGPFFGGLTTPIGFGLNPLKYLTGLARAAEEAGASVFHNSQVQNTEAAPDGQLLTCELGSVTAKHVIVATNGYSSEDLPSWLAGRYMPGQSNVLVTRPLSDEEIARQGWSTAQMSYDTRNLLHYFRLMPDRRFLFGMRGGLSGGLYADTRARDRVRSDFKAMFPAWSHVETPHVWSGMVCLARQRLPFIGAVPGRPGWWAGMCYHGNGIAMGSFGGKLLAELVQGITPDLYPEALRQPLQKFPFGRARRIVMPPLYAGLMLADR
ncbi:FAD-binding oxidoreductase [uncultured Roseobacter sp.]|uniref:NAD(P)/FAD-dependent oxidoreductase n=1 Tax=uncultured Roseobacter sp. TaxID=114847 RepID=UPI002615A1A5|nr:FAD-binding oxidoreductase [uncultured Roseobacter sp.]